MSRRIRLGESLVESGLITQAQLDEALQRRLTTGERIGEAVGLRVAAISISLVGSPASILAHHSFAAQYDATRPVEMRGTVTKVEWTNPHARLYIDVKDDKGQTANWNFETFRSEAAASA